MASFADHVIVTIINAKCHPAICRLFDESHGLICYHCRNNTKLIPVSDYFEWSKREIQVALESSDLPNENDTFGTMAAP